MKVLLIFFLAIVGILAAPTDVAIEPHIIGGVNALPGEFPYIVSLQWVLLQSSQHTCGGYY
jgi:secreted trypsin-like serine protease